MSEGSLYSKFKLKKFEHVLENQGILCTGMARVPVLGDWSLVHLVGGWGPGMVRSIASWVWVMVTWDPASCCQND